jgi:hypothetical protein
MPRRELPGVGGFYKVPGLHWSAQDCLNWIPVRAEAAGTRTQFMLRQPPGLRPLVRFGEGAGRGIRNVEGRLYAVVGTQLHQVTSALVAIPRGTVPGVGRVSMAHNQSGGGNQLAIDNGSARYVLNTATNEFGKVTDEGFPGSFMSFYIDQYLGFIEPQGRFWGHSDLADAHAYNTLDRYEAEADPDRIVTAHVSHREVLIFGRDTTEPFVNTGASTGTFERASNTVIEAGCSAKFSPVSLDNSVCFLDNRRVPRRLDGYTPVRIGQVAIEAALAECTSSEIARSWGFGWEDRGHAVWYLTVPGRFTFGYDFLTGEWHRRSSGERPDWRLGDLVFWNGMWVGQDYRDGALYVLDWDYFYDGTEELVRERVTGVLSDNQNNITANDLELIFGVGGKASPMTGFPTVPLGPALEGDVFTAEEGAAVSETIAGSDGTGALSYAVVGGTLPAGLTLASDGELTGTLTAEIGEYEFTVRVTDANGLWAEADFTFEVTEAEEEP